LFATHTGWFVSVADKGVVAVVRSEQWMQGSGEKRSGIDAKAGRARQDGQGAGSRALAGEGVKGAARVGLRASRLRVNDHTEG